MKLSIRKGFSFGLTSSIITTLGLIVGLQSSTHSATIVISGILVIALADSLSDALAIHVSEEYENKHSVREIWEATSTTFFSKIFFTLSFLIPVMLLPLGYAIGVSIIWGLAAISLLSYYIAKSEKAKPHKVIIEHIVITILVIIATHYIGDFVGAMI